MIHDQFWCVVDILAIPWESRGAALIYFTVRPVGHSWLFRRRILTRLQGDDIVSAHSAFFEHRYQHLYLVTPPCLQFNRSMRLKANKMGYSLNQRGLFAGVVRSTKDWSVKTNPGKSWRSIWRPWPFVSFLPARTTPMSVNETLCGLWRRFWLADRGCVSPRSGFILHDWFCQLSVRASPHD